MSTIRISTAGMAGIFLCLFGFVAHASSHQGDNVEGRVIKITDGDKVTIMLPDGSKLKVELAGIDAPEKNQPHYQIANQALSDKIFTEDVRVEVESWKRSSLVVGKIVLDGEYVNSWMVAEGHAWAYPQGSENPELMEIQMISKASARGIWALSDIERVPPWSGGRERGSAPGITLYRQKPIVAEARPVAAR